MSGGELWPSAGLWMLALLAVLVAATGLPVWALLIGVASGFAALGCALGVMDLTVLGALPGRLTGLLEHDLLQALPLYVAVGMLLQRVAVADALFASLAWLARRSGAGPALAALGVGALLAPMNGSVASSSALLARLVAPRLAERAGLGEVPRAAAVVSAAATIGVVVPPSLVLLLLGDAMMRAHTEATHLPGVSAALAAGQIINTQDVFRAALLPALAVLGLWAAVVMLSARRRPAGHASGRAAKPPADAGARPAPRTALLAAGSALAIVALLAGVFSGRVLAVEAAAAGGVVLMLATAASRRLSLAQWRAMLDDTLALSGALLALLVGATSFSLVFRLWGTDAWLTQLVLQAPLPPGVVAALVLSGVAACALALDAFEMIFVVIPLVAPALIAHLGDAQQAAVLLLLVLQASFLLPPLGYAVMLARSHGPWRHAISNRALLRAVAPFLAAQALVTALVFAWPALVHGLDTPATAVPVLSDEEIRARMDAMAR